MCAGMERSLTLTVNGAVKQLRSAVLSEALVELQLDPRKVAVERNLEIVPRSTFSSTRLVDGDRLEIVHFVGGG